ncbi:MAG: flagellar biosynthetic protein FliQ [Candidatus Baltobacteraceae bacterium]
MDAFDGLLRETLTIAALLCLPILLVATLVGTTVAVLQAATQIQEQTLTLLPKLIAVGVAVATCGAFGMHLCAGLFTDILQALPAIVSGQ